jgi:diacylglycerol kinase (ATP)
LFIVNPECGTRKAAREIAGLLARVNHLYGEVAVRYTEHRGHATELARSGASARHPLIVAVGGDGTFSEVVNGVLQATEESGGDPHDPRPARDDQPAVGLVSIGTGGDFRRTLGIGPGIEASLRALAADRDRWIDVVLAEFRGPEGGLVRRYFVNVLSAGVGGLVDHYIDSMPSFVGGRVGYYLAALGGVIAGKERRVLVRAEWQGEVRDETVPAYLVAVCNGRWFGGGMDVAPMAQADDGRLEIVTVTAPNKLFFLRRIRSVYGGRHLELPTVHHFPCTRIELRLEDRAAQHHFLLDVDGDALGSLPLTAEVLPGRLRVRA